jgi:hypothetical protein
MFRDRLEHSLHGDAALRFAPPPPVLSDVAALLVKRHGEGDRPQKTSGERQALLQRLRRAGFDWDKIRTADRFDAAWVLWDGPEPPAENERFLAALLDWAQNPWRPLQACRIAASWADAFDPRLESIGVVAAWLVSHAAQLPEPWPELADSFDIFSLDRAPANLAEVFIAARAPEPECFARLGLAGRTQAGGLRLAALGEAAALVQARLAHRPELAARLMELSRHQPAFHPSAGGAPAGRQVRSVRVKLAEALLLPWQQQDPAGPVKEQIVDYLLRYYDDPRIDKTIWRAVRPAATGILRDWLKAKTIASFFRLADRQHGATRSQARLRQEFWMSYIDRIDDAWLAAEGQSAAGLSAAKLGHGRLVGCRPGRCALLLRIGGMTIVEDSEAQNERVWLAGNRLAPPLYRQREDLYRPAMLASGADFSSSYSCNDGRAWQERLHGFIARHGGFAGRA